MEHAAASELPVLRILFYACYVPSIPRLKRLFWNLTDLMEKHQKLSLVSQVTDFKDEIKLIILLRFCFFSLYLWIEKIHRQGR